MALRIWTAGLAVALAAGVTGCERHSWNQVSELYRGHHGDHGAHAAPGDEGHGAKAAAHPEGKEATHGPKATEPAKEQPKPH